MLDLNAFLLRRGHNPTTALNIEKGGIQLTYWDGAQVQDLDLLDTQILEGALAGDLVPAIIRTPRARPSWQGFMAREFGFDFLPQSPSYGAILFCAVDDSAIDPSALRWVAWCFGTGSRALKRGACDPRFGLIAALNLLAPTGDVEGTSPERRAQLREMRYRTTAPYRQQTGHRAARDIPVEGFRIDRTSDLLATIGGKALDSAITLSVIGGRSLRFRAPVEDASGLQKLSDEVLALSRQRSYRSSFEWVDNIALIEDEPANEALRRRIIEMLLEDEVPASLDTILPDDLLDSDDSRSIAYVLYPNERVRAAASRNLTVSRIASLVAAAESDGDPTRALDYRLRFLDDEHGLIGTATVLECICADFLHEDEQVVAYDGDFYRVDGTFVERIDRELAALPTASMSFPLYRAEPEPEYVSRVGADAGDRFVVLDRELIRVEGEAGIEASDLVDISGAMIHVKRKGKSSVLSHLFLQAANSCEVLRRSRPAREQLAKLIEKRALRPSIASRINATHASTLGVNGPVEVVTAILGDWRRRSVASLPLFSRISLVQESRKISSLGCIPSIALIGQE